jgi:hypothetical protein
MIVYADLTLAMFAVVLLVVATLTLTGAATNYEHTYTTRNKVLLKLYNGYASCASEACVAHLLSHFNSSGFNLSVDGAKMVVWVET